MCRLRRRPPTWARPSGHRCASTRAPACDRSEEHTSELQSRPHLVCRLLLEKKKKKAKQQHMHHLVSTIIYAEYPENNRAADKHVRTVTVHEEMNFEQHANQSDVLHGREYYL